MDYKQSAIVRELKQRIAGGVYQEQLPTTLELADEFKVNPKTMSKALAQLVEAGLLERRRRSGTRIRTMPRAVPSDRLIEVIFEGFSAIFVHPFWSDIWVGLVQVLTDAGYRTVLTPLEADEETGMLKLERFSSCSSAGKIILGVNEPQFLRRMAASGVPCIVGGDPVDEPNIAQISIDFTQGVKDAVDFLNGRGCRDIAFIGMTQSFTSIRMLNKYYAFLKAVQHYRQVNPLLVEHARPPLGHGAAALRRLLGRIRPDALLVAYDSQLTEIMEVLTEQHLEIPVISCDGLNLPQLPADRHMVVAPRRRCGELLARSLLTAIAAGEPPKSQVLQAVFR